MNYHTIKVDYEEHKPFMEPLAWDDEEYYFMYRDKESRIQYLVDNDNLACILYNPGPYWIDDEHSPKSMEAGFYILTEDNELYLITELGDGYYDQNETYDFEEYIREAEVDGVLWKDVIDLIPLYFL